MPHTSQIDSQNMSSINNEARPAAQGAIDECDEAMQSPHSQSAAAAMAEAARTDSQAASRAP